MLFRLLVLFVAIGLLTAPVFAQSTYKTWNNPDATSSAGSQDAQLQVFVKKLNELILKAEQARAADPVFLQDLKDLASGFERPWQRLVFNDEFLDGNYDFDPQWQVTSGEYWIEKGWGLRSAIEAGSQSASNQNTQQRNQDAAAVLFGQILNQALGGQGTVTQNPARKSEATIHTKANIPNAFALETQFSSWTADGRLEMVMYQGNLGTSAQTAGYRLAYVPGGKLELVRVSSRGSIVMDAVTLKSPLEDKNFHAVEWLRYGDGRMVVKIDGQQLLDVTDRGFRDPFNGFALINQGGDYIVKKVKISGAS